MFCGKCGANISEGSKKCPNCGTPVRNNEFLGGFQDILRTDVTSMQAFRQPNYSAPVQQMPACEPKKNNTLLYIAVGIAALSLLVNLFLGIRLLRKNGTISDLDSTVSQQEARIESLETEISRLNGEIEELSETPEPAAEEIPEDTITGFVYLDNNRNGSYDADTDRPYSGLEIELYKYSDADPSDAREYKSSAKTDRNGIFTFPGLKEGYYRLKPKTTADLQVLQGSESINSGQGKSSSGIRKIVVPNTDSERYSIGVIRIIQTETEDDD
ncbi:MAG: zinc-ribbon domain-containing protein [Solobacterium sp.]|nr:zinc-ribbon domain-containing protein [Solobacterium sp.]